MKGYDARGGSVSGLLIRIRLFASSLAPLFVILAVRFMEPWLEVVCAMVAFLGFATFLLLLRAAGKISPDPHEVTSVADRGPEVAGYVATYLLPFVTVAEPTGRDLLAYVLFLVVVGLVYVRSDMVKS